MAKSPILGGFSTQRSPNAADNIAINLGVEVIETKDGKVPGLLFGMSGLDLLVTVGDGPGRGALPLNDVLYAVSGNKVFSITANGVKTELGEITIGTNLVSILQNTTQLLIVDGVGAWIVPGGYPLASGTITSGGSLYAVDDKITLLASSGSQSAYPIARVASIANHAVALYHLANAGTTYATGVSATAPIQPQPGHGTGLTLNLTAVSGSITVATVNSGGIDYAVNDTGDITGGGSQDAVYLVTGVTAGAVTSLTLLNRGTGYGTGTAVATSAAVQNIVANSGIGLTFNITAAGPITGSSIANAGRGFAPANYGYLTGGTGDATYVVDTVTPLGAVTSITIVQGGAIADVAVSFTQKTTTGSGVGFELQSPVYDAFLALVPIVLPFPNPVKGVVSDGFGVMVFLHSQKIAASEELDLSTWNDLSFGVANQSPDYNVGIELLHDQVYLLKEKNAEVWVDQGLPNFAFAPLSGVHIEYGTAAAFSSAKVGNDLIWLSRNDQGQGIFVEVSAYTPKPISSQALTNEIQKYANIGDCIAYAREEGGHVYYVATFPEANATWCYDKTTSDMVGYPIWTMLSALDNGQDNRHWGNYFTPYKVGAQPSTIITAYQPRSVEFTSPTEMVSATGLVGLPLSFSSALFSIWLLMPDADPHRVYFSNQTDDNLGSPNPGLQIKVQNDTEGSPQISIHAYDVSSALIVVADYDFATWDGWVNMLVSIDTATQKIQVYMNTIIAGALVEELLVGLVTWSSTQPIAASAAQSWHVAASP